MHFSDLILLLWQLIIFMNPQYILLFLCICTLVFIHKKVIKGNRIHAEQKEKNIQWRYTENKRASKRHLPKSESELRYFARVSSSCSIYGTTRVTLATNPVIVMNNKHSIFVVIAMSFILRFIESKLPLWYLQNFSTFIFLLVIGVELFLNYSPFSMHF
jgi:hypothetical protein